MDALRGFTLLLLCQSAGEALAGWRIGRCRDRCSASSSWPRCCSGRCCACRWRPSPSPCWATCRCSSCRWRGRRRPPRAHRPVRAADAAGAGAVDLGRAAGVGTRAARAAAARRRRDAGALRSPTCRASSISGSIWRPRRCSAYGHAGVYVAASALYERLDRAPGPTRCCARWSCWRCCWRPRAPPTRCTSPARSSSTSCSARPVWRWPGRCGSAAPSCAPAPARCCWRRWPAGPRQRQRGGHRLGAGACRARFVASLAPKSVTAPVAMGIAAQLGGIPALAAVFAVLTG